MEGMNETGSLSRTKTKGAVLIAVLVVSSVGLGIVLSQPPLKTVYSVEWTMDDLDEGVSRYVIYLYELRGSVINVTFEDNPELLARLDYELTSGSTEILSINDHDSNELRITSTSDSRPKTIDLVLGTSIPYFLDFSSYNISVTICYDNGADLRDAGLTFEGAESHLDFIMTENVTFSSSESMTMSVQYTQSARVFIDLPEGMDAALGFRNYQSCDVDWSGRWYKPHIEFNVYETSDEYSPPLLGSVQADVILARLG